ncbi:MAG TPA: helix-turn-helix domain-containing protein [Candidatus Deferrimicrobium sp.]|nr:helix-turn-helix domain-containing protein [Candidatus Deferrimicrobium sp.]
MRELPVLGQPPVERADAARNRRRILEAAERLFAERGVEAVPMDDVAAAAGVGKGTLYRRFGDRAGLGIAVLDERERELQDRILGGPPPLGPGAPPTERLTAFVEAYLAYAWRNLELLVVAETASPGARYRSGVYAGFRRHVEILLGAAGAADPVLGAELLLAPLAGDLLRHLRLGRELEADRIGAGIQALASGLIPS